jgi:hypothetical protein
MAGLVVLRPGVDWTATGGLFDWTVEFLIDRVSHPESVARLREILENNLGSLWLSDFPSAAREEIVTHLRNDLVTVAERDLPESPHRADALRHLHDLVRLTDDPGDRRHQR